MFTVLLFVWTVGVVLATTADTTTADTNTKDQQSPLSPRAKRGAAYAGGHGDFSGVAKQSTFSALGSYGGFVGHGSGGSTAGGYGAGSGRNGLGAAGGITVAGAFGSYGGYLGHKGPTVLSSGGFGNGGLLFGKI